jgi:hypothetical protein
MHWSRYVQTRLGCWASWAHSVSAHMSEPLGFSAMKWRPKWSCSWATRPAKRPSAIEDRLDLTHPL